MANPNRTDYEGPTLSGPGMLWINSRVIDPDVLPVESFNKWYENVHIPDIIKAKPGGIVASWRYKCLNQARQAPYLAVYKVPDMSFLQSLEFKAIPMTHPSLPGNGPIHRFADFDARFMGHVETWKRSDAKNGRTALLVSEAIEPADDDAENFHAWFQEHYVKEISRKAGWQRTTLLKLVFKKQNKNDPDAAKAVTPTWIALHEFLPGSIPECQDQSSLLGRSEIVKKMADEAKKIDVAAFEALSSFGEVNQRWADVSETVL